jgi:hypothetical protein
MTERNGQLGETIRGLSVPAHRADFWEELRESLDSTELGAGRARSKSRVFLAAAVVITVVGVSLRIYGARTGETGVNVTSRPVPAMVTGTLRTELHQPGDSEHVDEQEFAVASDGSTYLTTEQGAGALSFDARDRRQVVKQPEGSGSGAIGWFLRTNAEPQWSYLFLSSGAFEEAAARSDGVRGAPTMVLGRKAMQYERSGKLASIGGAPADKTTVVVDDETHLLLRRVDQYQGATTAAIEVTALETHTAIDRSRFSLTPPAGARILDDIDEQNRESSLERLDADLGYDVTAPRQLHDFALTDVVVRAGNGPLRGQTVTQPDRAVLVYRDAYAAVEVIVHRQPPAYSADADPLGPGALEPSLVPDEGGDIHVVAGTGRTVPHAWRSQGDFVVVVAGAMDASELVDAVRSISAR